MAGSSSRSEGEFVISIGTGRSEEKDSSNYKDPKAAGAEKPDDDGVAPTSSSHQQHSTSTNDEISSSHDLPSNLRESRPLEEEEDEDEDEGEELIPQQMLVGVMTFLSLWVFLSYIGLCYLEAAAKKGKIPGFVLWKSCLVLLQVILVGINAIQFFILGAVSRIQGRFHCNNLVHDFERDSVFSAHILLCINLTIYVIDRGELSKTRITKTLAAILIGCVLWTLTTRLVLTVASKFRIKDFPEKIADSLSNKYLLKALSRPPVMGPMLPAATAGGPHRGSFSFSFLTKRENVGLAVSEGSKGVEKLRTYVKITKKEKQSIEGVSYRTLRFLTHNVLETPLSIINNPFDDIERQTDFKITNEWEAETAADRIFSNVANTDPKYMNEDELLRILPMKDVKALQSQVHGTDPSDGRISKIALTQWVLKVLREHKAFTSSSNYTNAVVKQLDQFMACVLLLLMLIIWLLLIGCPTPKIQVFLSLLLGASFVFGNTCKNIFEGIIYVVIMHPFDIGDLCVVDDGQVLLVEGGDIYTTDFSDVDTDEKVFYPNSLLCSKPIKNLTRSPDMKETLKIIIDNPGQQLQDQKEFIERRIVEYLKSQPKQWQPRPVLYEMKETVDEENLTIVLHCFRKMSLQNWKERVSQMNMLKKEIKKITEELRSEFSVAEQATSSR